MKQECLTDEQFEAMLSDYKVIDPQLYCPQKNRIRRMCVTPYCQNYSLICPDEECKTCAKNHHCCLSLKVSGLTSMLNQRVQKQKNFIAEVSKIQDQFIRQVHNSRFDLAKKHLFWNMDEDFLEEIYRNKSTQCLIGAQAEALYKRLKESNSNITQNSIPLLEYYKKAMRRLINDMLNLKNRLYKSFININQFYKLDNTIESSILKKHLACSLEEFKGYNSYLVNNSKLLVDQLAKEQTQFIIEALQYPKKIQFLYRASQHGFSAYSFHKKCDNIPNTLTIVRTQFGKTIAGFSKYTWNAVNDNSWVNDVGKKTFLLSLDLKEKMVPISQNYLIYSSSKNGPVFGNDLQIRDQSINQQSANILLFISQFN